ncbi:MAG TPA: tetratricopeptide repeat protein [Ktedonosporobacter sp.]|nr:tetratricopeptide repeat protein [Ktedonosporobacter sp.]
MTQAQSAEEKARLKKQWTDLAVKQAQEGQWEEAVTTNRNILDLFPSEPDAFNRLGKAHSELGQYSEARQAYAQTLKYSPKNTIAKKNLDRLALLTESPAQIHTGTDRINTDLYIEETGKTGSTDLINLASPSILAKLGVGDKVQLKVSGHTLMVLSTSGESIGQVEPRLANRLINFMEGLNRYDAAVSVMEPGQVRLRIREVYQHPSMFGKVSFPSQGGSDAPRGYIRDTLLRDRNEDDDELGNDDEYYDGGDEPDDMTEIDFEGNVESEE